MTLISADNEAVTILMDVQTHLPLRRTFQWRDPVYKDKNLDAEEYDDYHTIDGFPTPFTITRFKNDDDDPAVLSGSRELQPGVAGRFLERGCSRAAHQEVARARPDRPGAGLRYNSVERKAALPIALWSHE